MDVIIFAIIFVAVCLAAGIWGADSRPRVNEHDRWWPGTR